MPTAGVIGFGLKRIWGGGGERGRSWVFCSAMNAI